MEVLRAHFGKWPWLYPAKDGRVVYEHDDKKWFLDDEPSPAQHGDYDFGQTSPAVVPFERADFGGCDRLAWPRGACAIEQRTQPVYWGARFACWIERTTLVIVDAERATVARLDAPIIAPYARLMAHGDRLWVSGDVDAVAFAVADLAALFDAEAGRIDIAVRERYPCRRPDAVEKARVVDLMGTEARALALGRQRTIEFPPVTGLQMPMDVTFYDELVPDRFLYIELPGQPRRALHALDGTTCAATLALHDAVDPAGGLRPPAPTAREADLDRLFETLADDPDEATRVVIVDLLEDAGEPYAPLLAALLANPHADAAARREALGPLASYFTRVEYAGGLPRVATLAADAPPDDGIGDAVAADRRLGLFRTLRIGEGHYKIYTKLVCSPRALGLRHVDAPRASILTALIAAGRRNLERLSSVKFVSRETIEALADPTFDRVRDLEVPTAAPQVAKLLEFVTRDELGFFRRAPRRLVLTTRDSEAALIPAVEVAWARLPLLGVTVGDRTWLRET